MRIIKILLIILGCIYLNCCNNEMEQKQKEVEGFSFNFLDTISINELEFLKGVYIGTRKQGELVDRFYVTYENTSYHLPIYNSFKTKEKIMNPEWYDVVKFARSKKIDSADAYEYVKTYTNNVLSVFNKSKALNIKSDSSLGNFIIFEYSNHQIVYLFPDGQIFHPFWKEYFNKAREIKKNWYVEK